MLLHSLPDITSETKTESPAALNWVGMEEIAVPIMINLQDGQHQTTSAKSNIFVSLDNSDAKGIHMSRLYTVINQLGFRSCEQSSIEELLGKMIDSQEGLSTQSKIELSFEIILQKPALLSDTSGYQSYPVVIKAEKGNGNMHSVLELVIPYSSTCPCSASLARQLHAKAIDLKFADDTINKNALLDWQQSESGSVATPHSQRSYAYIKMNLADNEWPDIPALIVQLEQLIGTPVQTSVKRQDEQAFAKLNAENLMFCEDAARRIKSGLENMKVVQDYWFKVEHQESLHAHNAVVIDYTNPAL